ncbi:hypothetical protein [Roseicella sp. DB1501]|uniref:hypothetical protein n=1 Tax=Roseicella sp. DB1501 TaxID=2730925 RepID=UPI00149123BA|nr:hypothetical protein [Roseicella sp. DB1501]NOG71544.1 hypothetical protein [Roseicella sp. DB1501]
MKVEIVARKQRQWAWTVCRDVGDTTIITATRAYRHPDDAWQAGRKVLRALEQGASLKQASELSQAA